MEFDPRFSDSVGAKTLLERGIEPIIERDVSAEKPDAQAEQIQQTKERLVQQMQDGGEASSEALPLRLFQ